MRAHLQRHNFEDDNGNLTRPWNVLDGVPMDCIEQWLLPLFGLAKIKCQCPSCGGGGRSVLHCGGAAGVCSRVARSKAAKCWNCEQDVGVSVA